MTALFPLSVLTEVRARFAAELAVISSRPADPHACVMVTLDDSPMFVQISEDGEKILQLAPTLISTATVTSRPHAGHIVKLIKRMIRERGVDPAYAGELKIKAVQEVYRFAIDRIDAALALHQRPDNATVH